MRTIAVLMMATVSLAACRADSFSAPASVDCTGEPGCRPTTSAPIDQSVYASLDDASARLVSGIGDAATQRALTDLLHELTQALREGRTSDARAQLAQVYARLTPLRVALPDGTQIDPPDVAALRLGLVPAANALGVRTQ